MSNTVKKSFQFSVKRSIPIMIGYFPLGIAFGILMSKAGYNFIWSAFTSLFVYAGSLQMLMVSFFSEGTPISLIAVTALLLNSRHIFYGLSFVENSADTVFKIFSHIWNVGRKLFSSMLIYSGKRNQRKICTYFLNSSYLDLLDNLFHTRRNYRTTHNF